MPDQEKMKRTQRVLPRILVGAAVIGFVGLGAFGCADRRPRTEAEAKREFAQKIVNGGFVKMTDVTARSYDPITFDLIDIEISDYDRIIRAARAEILISRAHNTVSLRLIDVVAADSTPGVEALVSMESMTTDPVKLGYDVIY